MNVHKNARSCPLSRELLFKRVCEQGWSVRAASEAAGMSDRRGREWLRRAEQGEPLTDRSSRPSSGPATSVATRVRIIQLRRQWLTVRQIAKAVGVGTSTAARICRAAGLSRLKQLDAPPPAVRYQRDRPGELLHIDVKRLGRFDRVGHRITRRRSYGSSETRLRVRPRRHRRRLTCLLRRDLSRRVHRQRHPVLHQRSGLVRATRGHRRRSDHRQRPSLQVAPLRRVLPIEEHQTSEDQTPSALRPTAKSNASSRPCFASGPTASRTAHRPSASAGSRRIFTSITSIELTQLFRTMRRSVAWIGRTS